MAGPPASTLHHAALPHRGGAVRVARLLASAGLDAGAAVRLSFELAESDPEALVGQTGDGVELLGPTRPESLGALLAAQPHKALVHLHTSSAWPQLLAGLLAAGRAGTVVLTLHDATPLTGGCAYPLDCPHFPRCTAPCPRAFSGARERQAETLALLNRLQPVIVSPSRWLAGLAAQALPELPARVIPNGVPWPEAASLPSRTRARAVLGLAPGASVALFAAHGGLRAAYKAGDKWLECWRQLRAGLPGGGAGARAFAVGGDTAGEEDGLTLWPYVDRARLALVMRAADVLVYPTLADNHPLVLLEAAANALPVVSFGVGGVPEIVADGETGLLVDPAAGLEGLCAAAAGLLADKARAQGMGSLARERGAGRFDARRMAADYAAVYAELFGPGGG